MTDLNDLIGKTVKVTRMTNPFAKGWIGKSGMVTGLTSHPKMVDVDIDGDSVWVLADNLIIEDGPR